MSCWITTTTIVGITIFFSPTGSRMSRASATRFSYCLNDCGIIFEAAAVVVRLKFWIMIASSCCGTGSLISSSLRSSHGRRRSPNQLMKERREMLSPSSPSDFAAAAAACSRGINQRYSTSVPGTVTVADTTIGVQLRCAANFTAS